MGSHQTRTRFACVGAAVVLSALHLGCGNAEETYGVSKQGGSESSESNPAAEFSYEGYTALLQKYVDGEGLVDYGALRTNRGPLDAFNRSMATLPRSAYEAWPEAERLAFWINAYNSITLQRIIDHYPIKKGGIIVSLRYPANSIRQIGGVWKELTNTVMGKEITLDSIEHDILRVQFSEPRIHTAIVCAALSCPPLRNEAFTAEGLDVQLDHQSREFFANDERFRVDRNKKRVYLSPILDWFGKDFAGVYNTDATVSGHGKTEGAVLEFVSRYVGDEDAEFILTADYSVSFLDYDWSLNEQ